MNCIICNKELSGKQKLFCSKKCKSTKQNNSYECQQKRAHTRKMECVAKLGGECCKCGYKKNYSALQFHHINPENKLFNLDSRNLSNTSQDKIDAELEKVILVCSNCHAELHHPNFNMVGRVGFEPTVKAL